MRLISHARRLLSKVSWSRPLLIFYPLYLAALTFKLWGLISVGDILPGGDTFSHYLALERLVSGLQSGQLSPYFKGWFGGEPLFQFYQPLAFMIMAGFYFLFGKLVSLAIILRLFIFFSLAIFPWAFHAFLKEFFDERTARLGVWLSFLWLFYPKLIASIGAGAAGAIFYGLFVQVFAISLLLWYLVSLKRLLEADKATLRHCLLLAVLAAAIVAAHTLTALAMGIISVILVIYQRRQLWRRTIARGLLSAVAVAFLLCTFWLTPFLQHFSYTSAERVDFDGYISSALNPFFYFDLSNWASAPENFDYAWLAAAALFFIGLADLIRDRKYFVPLTFFILFFACNLDYVNKVIFPELPLHYYRIVAYELVLYLAIAGAGLARVGRLAAEKKRWAQVAIFLAAASLLHYVWMYNLSGADNKFNVKPRLSGVPSDFLYEWRQDDFPLVDFGRQALDFMRSPDLPEAPRRTLSDINIFTMVEELGSIHYFNNMLPLANGQDVIAGLFAESAWQLPFIWSATNAITGNNVTWGRVRDLYNDNYFNQQPVDTMVERVRLLGVNYIIMTSNVLESRFREGLEGVSKLAEFGPISVYHIADSRPLVYRPSFAPGLYIGDGAEAFREFALGWYSEFELLDKPVAWEQRALSDLTRADLVPFSYLIVRADPRRLSAEGLSLLRDSGKPLIFLHQDTARAGVVGGRPVDDIPDFRPVVQYGGPYLVVSQPNVAGLQQLRDFILVNATSSAASVEELEVHEFSDDAVSFEAQGPVIVNLSYFPYWHRTDGERVYPVTPGQMLVFADGRVDMEYGADAWAGFWTWISALTLVGVIAALIAVRKKKA